MKIKFNCTVLLFKKASIDIIKASACSDPEDTFKLTLRAFQIHVNTPKSESLNYKNPIYLIGPKSQKPCINFQSYLNKLFNLKSLNHGIFVIEKKNDSFHWDRYSHVNILDYISDFSATSGKTCTHK